MLPMRVVSNTSPLSNLAVIGRLEVLRTQFGNVAIPEAVAAELAHLEHATAAQAIDLAYTEGWLTVENASDRTLIQVLKTSLDAGEAEAICLAQELKADLLVMDETAGRATARNLGLRVAGTLGLLLKEKRNGGLPSLQAEIEKLVNEAGFYVSEAVAHAFLREAGEV